MIVRSVRCTNSESVKLSMDHLPPCFSALKGMSRLTEITHKRLASYYLLLKKDQHCNSDFFNSLLIVFFIALVYNYVSKRSRSTAAHPQKEIDFNLAITEGIQADSYHLCCIICYCYYIIMC